MVSWYSPAGTTCAAGTAPNTVWSFARPVPAPVTVFVPTVLPQIVLRCCVGIELVVEDLRPGHHAPLIDRGAGRGALVEADVVGRVRRAGHAQRRRSPQCVGRLRGVGAEGEIPRRHFANRLHRRRDLEGRGRRLLLRQETGPGQQAQHQKNRGTLLHRLFLLHPVRSTRTSIWTWLCMLHRELRCDGSGPSSPSPPCRRCPSGRPTPRPRACRCGSRSSRRASSAPPT